LRAEIADQVKPICSPMVRERPGSAPAVSRAPSPVLTCQTAGAPDDSIFAKLNLAAWANPARARTNYS
jgi:hypothetical protein